MAQGYNRGQPVRLDEALALPYSPSIRCWFWCAALNPEALGHLLRCELRGDHATVCQCRRCGAKDMTARVYHEPAKQEPLWTRVVGCRLVGHSPSHGAFAMIQIPPQGVRHRRS